MATGKILKKAYAAFVRTKSYSVAEAVKMEKNTVRECLNLLIHLGLAKKINHEEARASDHRGGWVRVEYQAIAAKTTVIDTTAIESKE